MGLRDDLGSEVGKIVKSAWSEREGSVVPDYTSIQQGNDAVKIEATVLYADLADSTQLVDAHPPGFAAEVYKAFLHCAATLIRASGGTITAYDGDRIMAVYIGSAKSSSAVRAALKLNFVVGEVIQPALAAQYPHVPYKIRHVVGVDTSDLFVAKTGIRGNNDLVWVGRAANHAAKLSAMPESHQSYISDAVFRKLTSDVKTSQDGRPMWESLSWNEMDGRRIYRSSWSYEVD